MDSAVKENKRITVLISVYACDPVRGSEFGMGWKWVETLAGLVNLIVITTDLYGSQKRIEKRIEGNKNYFKNTSFYFIKKEVFGKFYSVMSLLFRPIYYVKYTKWQMQAFEVADKIVKDHHVDIVHHLNITGFREPGFFWRLNKPFVWGPVGGACFFPMRFAGMLDFPGICFQILRNLSNYFQLRYAPRVRQAMKRADAVVAATGEDAAAFHRHFAVATTVIGDTGAEAALIMSPVRRPSDPSRPLRLVWSGKHISRKGLPLAIRSFAATPDHLRVEMIVLGGGRLTGQARRLACRLGVSSRVTWRGMLSRGEALEAMADADALICTSVLEGTSGVVIEALSLGLPVICFDRCGMGDTINTDCGVKIQVTTYQKAVADFSRAVESLARDRELLRRLSVGARQRAAQLTWEQAAQRMLEVYRGALARSDASLERIA